MNSSNKIIINTAVSYVALILKMLIGFFSIRLILQALGEESYGVYMTVAGVAGMLDILNNNMTNTSMRYLAYSLGSKNDDRIKKTFATSLYIHYVVGFLTVALMELGGWCMFQWILNIPSESLFSAKVVYQFMIVSMFISVVAVPYDAVMNAHEHIWILSIFDILSAILNFTLAIYLIHCGFDRLITYGFFVFLIQVLLRVSKVQFAKRYYFECNSYSFRDFDKLLAKEIFSFTGWNLFGSLASLGTTQFRALLINSFFGVLLNAAEGISRQIGNYVNTFAASMTRAINPQIMKSEGGGDRSRMIYICELGAKYSSFLFAFIGVPVMLETDWLLTVWLKEVPEYASIFCKLVMLQMLIEKLTFQIGHAIRAVGNIRNFQIVESLACLVYLPVAYVFLSKGTGPISLYLISLLSNFLCMLVRMYYGKKIAGIDPLDYFRSAMYPIVIPLLVAYLLGLGLTTILPTSFLRVIITTFIFCLSFTTLFIILGMKRLEREKWRNVVMKAIKFF